MNKRKLLALALSLCMVAILAVGGTLAYFTSEDSAENVFTMGNVQIDLEETFEQNSELAPGLDIEKKVWVTNTGSYDAYVRVHIAIPANMDDGDPNFDASRNFLHFNFAKDSVAEGEWNWSTAVDGSNYPAGTDSKWNYYTETIDGVEYGVYVVTYETALVSGESTATNAIHNVYLDPTVDAVVNEDGTTTYTDSKGNEITLTEDQANNIQIKVWAEGTQATEGVFTDAYNALNTAFGVPGTYNPWAE